MSKKIIAIAGIATALTVGYFMIPKNESVVAGGVDRAEVEGIVKDYLLNNPETIIESLNKFQMKQQQEQMAKSKEAVSAVEKDLKANTTSPFAGNAKGDVLVVEFFDYNCGYCKKAFPTVAKLLEDDKNVKVMFAELPILSPTSEKAARAALAVHFLDNSKYFDYHRKLMEFSGNKTDDILLKIAEEVGMKADDVKKKMDSEEVSKELTNIRDLSQKIGIRGTPAFLVGTEMVPGAVDVETLKKLVASARGEKPKDEGKKE